MSLAVVDALERGPVSVAIDLFPALDHGNCSSGFRESSTAMAIDPCATCSMDSWHISWLIPSWRRQDCRPTGWTPDDSGGEGTADTPAEVPSVQHQGSAADIGRHGDGWRSVAGRDRPQDHGITTRERPVLLRGVMDLDADTGGYNLQAAFSTGWVCRGGGGAGFAAQERVTGPATALGPESYSVTMALGPSIGLQSFVSQLE